MDQWTYFHTKGVLDQATAFELLRIAVNVPGQIDISDKLKALRQHHVYPCQPPIPLVDAIHEAVNQEAAEHEPADQVAMVEGLEVPDPEPADQLAPVGGLDAQNAEELSDSGTSEDEGPEGPHQQNDSEAEVSSNESQSEAPPTPSDPATPSSTTSTPSPTGSIQSEWATPKGTVVPGPPIIEEFDESKENTAFQSAMGESFPLREATPPSSDVSTISSPNTDDLEYQRKLTIAASSPGDDADVETPQEASEDPSDSPNSSSSAGDDAPPPKLPIRCEPSTSRVTRSSVAHSAAQAIKKSDLFLKNTTKNLLVVNSRTNSLFTKKAAAARKSRSTASPRLRLQRQQRGAVTSEDASSGAEDPRAARSKSAPSEVEEVCPVHQSSRAFGAALEKNPGKLPDFECSCPKCSSCSKLLPSCDCGKKQEEKEDEPRNTIPSTPKMKTRFEGVPQGRWDPRTIRYEAFRRAVRRGGGGGGGDAVLPD